MSPRDPLIVQNFQSLCPNDLEAILGALEEGKAIMTRLSDATDALIAETADSKTKLASIETYIRGIPDVVGAAVAQALADANVADDVAAAAVEAATKEVSDSTDAALAAIPANTPPADTGDGA